MIDRVMVSPSTLGKPGSSSMLSALLSAMLRGELPAMLLEEGWDAGSHLGGHWIKFYKIK